MGETWLYLAGPEADTVAALWAGPTLDAREVYGWLAGLKASDGDTIDDVNRELLDS